jgi:predicted peroxiredoxin
MESVEKLLLRSGQYSGKQEEPTMMTAMTYSLDPAPVDPSPQNHPLTILLMSGDDDGGKRATLAFVAAVSAAAMERMVQVFLAGDGVLWGNPEEARQVEITGFPPLAELIEEYLELGGKLTACSTCERFCMGRQDKPIQRWSALEVRGMAALLESQGSGHSLSF